MPPYVYVWPDDAEPGRAARDFEPLGLVGAPLRLVMSYSNGRRKKAGLWPAFEGGLS